MVILQKVERVVMIMAVKEDCGKVAGPQECAGCGKKIHDKFLLKVRADSHHNFSEGYIPLENEEVFFCNNNMQEKNIFLFFNVHLNPIHMAMIAKKKNVINTLKYDADEC